MRPSRAAEGALLLLRTTRIGEGGRKGPDGQGRTKGAKTRSGAAARNSASRGRIGTDCRPAARTTKRMVLSLGGESARRESIKVQEGCISLARATHTRAHADAKSRRSAHHPPPPLPLLLAANRPPLSVPLPVSSSLPLTPSRSSRATRQTPKMYVHLLSPPLPLTVYTRACRATDRSH